MNQVQKKSFSEKLRVWRNAIAKFLAFKSFTSVTIGVMLILWLLVQCYISGDWPFDYKDDWPVSHGRPWRYTFGIIQNPQADLLNNCLQLIVFSLNTAFIAMVLKSNRFTFIVFVICALVFYISIDYFYWLID